MSLPTETSAVPSDKVPRQKTVVGAAFACTAVLTVVTGVIATTPAPARLFAQIYQEWYLWLLIAQGISMALVLFACGRPKTMGQWLAIAAMNLFLVLLAALHAFSLLEYLCLRFLQVLLRVAVVGCWTFAVVGTPIVVYWIWRRSRGIRKPLPLAKCWFACLILVLVAEPVAYVIKSTRERLNIPVLPAGQTDGEFHVAAIGESSMIGWPYVSRADDKGTVDPRFCIPAVYAWRLGQFYPEKKIVMHNIAVQGLSVKLAIEQLSKLKQRPDLILVYAGHNEFYHDVEELSTQSKPLFYWLDRHLNASPTFYLVNSELAARSALRELVVGEGRVFAEHPVSNRLTFQHRLERFRRQLEQFAGYCRDNGITSQWIVPASAESVYEPDRSVVSEGTSSSEVNRMRSRYDEALVLEQSKKWQEAAAIYREELVKQPGFAEFHFRLAECLVEMGQYDEAHKEFVLARDTDACPTRANSDYCRQIAEVAEEFQILHFDAADVLRPETPHGIIDRSMIHDNVHPTLRGFYLIAMHAADQISQSGILAPKLGAPHNAAPVTLLDAVKAQKLSVGDLVDAYHHTADDLRWLGRLRWDESRRKREADEYDRKSQQLKSGEIKPGQNGTERID